MNPAAHEMDWQRSLSNLSEALGASLSVSVIRDVPRENVEPIVQNVSPGEYQFVIPLAREGGELTAAVGSLDAPAGDLATRLLQLAVRYDEERRISEEQRLDLDACAEHFHRELERLGWLRRQLGRLSHCDSAETYEDFADEILRSLCQIINAQSLLVIAAEREAESLDQASPRVGRVAARVGLGQSVLEDAAARQLVDRLRARAGARPLVMNEMNRSRPSAGPPEVDSCILVPVILHETLLGWLLAINRISKSRVSGAEAGRARAQSSDDEFGSPEAGLMESAAVILAAHRRSGRLFGAREAAGQEHAGSL